MVIVVRRNTSDLAGNRFPISRSIPERNILRCRLQEVEKCTVETEHSGTRNK